MKQKCQCHDSRFRNSVLSCTQLFASEEKRASQQLRVTVHGAPGPEPFTVVCVTEQTTAKQLLDMVSDLEDTFTTWIIAPRAKDDQFWFNVWLFEIICCGVLCALKISVLTCPAGCRVVRKPVPVLPLWGESASDEGAQRGEALSPATSFNTWGGGG